MQLTCKYSGVSFTLESFKGINPTNWEHPFLSHGKDLYLSPSLGNIDNFIPYSVTERRLIYIAMLRYLTPLISFEAYAEPADNLVLTSFPELRSIALWVKARPKAILEELPLFRVDADTCNMVSFVEGYLPELATIRKQIRGRNNDAALDRVLARLDAQAKRREAFGKEPLTTETLYWIFRAASIPECDWEFYRSYLYNPPLSVALKLNNPVANLLDLEEYLEAWFSTSIIKIYLLRRVRYYLEQLSELGLSLPATYYELDNETGEYVAKHKTTSASRFTFKQVEPLVVKVGKPERKNYDTPVAFAKALAQWIKL